nr:FRG domain-containing protein [uncultured Flavobacterium sp.]
MNECKIKENEITTVSSYIEVINELSNNSSLYFRGHSNHEYELKPTIARTNKNLLAQEHKIYRDTILNSPQQFSGKNTIESLTFMQHFGIPTRILDITENPLVALYFACLDSKNVKIDKCHFKNLKAVCKDEIFKEIDLINLETKGEVIVFNVPDENICYYDSDKVSILSNLAKCDFSFKYQYFKIFSLMNKIDSIDNTIKRLIINDEREIKYYDIFEFLHSNNFFYEEYYDFLIRREFIPGQCIIKSQNKVKNKFRIENLSESEKDFINYHTLEYIKYKLSLEIEEQKEILSKSDLAKLVHFVREDKPFFEPKINPLDISKIIIVKPKLDNERIIRQQGAFFLFGNLKNRKNKEIPIISDSWILERITINEDSKKDILMELDKLGINELSLFPGISSVANYVKNKYSN